MKLRMKHDNREANEEAGRMKRLSLLWLLLFLFLLIPQEVKAAEENYFENPTHIYEQFQDEIYIEEYTL